MERNFHFSKIHKKRRFEFSSEPALYVYQKGTSLSEEMTFILFPRVLPVPDGYTFVLPD